MNTALVHPAPNKGGTRQLAAAAHGACPLKAESFIIDYNAYHHGKRIRGMKHALKAPAAAAGSSSCPLLVRVTWRSVGSNPIRPEFRQGYPLNLSISISGGKETNRDSLSNGERKGISPVCKSLTFGQRIVVWSSISWSRASPSILE